MKVKERVDAVRRLMKQNQVEAYFVPSSDPHQSEYVPECWQRRPWISGFTGSAGDVLVTHAVAGLWTDGRYFLQAEEELRGSGIKLFRSGQPGVPSLTEFLTRNLSAGESLGVDPRTVSMRRARELRAALTRSKASLRFLDQNLVDEVWSDRPDLPKAEARPLPLKFAGEATGAKLKRLRQAMKEHKVDAHVLSALDAVAWLFNIRGRDVMYNPVVIAYAIVTGGEATLFIDSAKVTAAVRQSLEPKVRLRPYEEFSAALEELAGRGARVWVEEQSASAWIEQKLEGADLVTDLSPVTLMKSRKNAVEAEGMRAAHVRDGAAVARFLAWLDRAVQKEQLTEISAAKKLEELRREGENFQGLSFRTISGFGPHGAIIHYTVTPKSDVPIRPEGIYLLDSGAQYLDGTTDITRTVLLGKRPTAEQKDRFTRVLKGHIALARARFPQGVGGGRLDALARTSLWEVARLHPRDGAWSRLVPQCARRPALDRPEPRYRDPNRGGEHLQQRTGLLQSGGIRDPDRESGPDLRERGRRGEWPALSGVRDLDDVPDRHASGRSQDSDAGRTEMAQRLPQARGKEARSLHGQVRACMAEERVRTRLSVSSIGLLAPRARHSAPGRDRYLNSPFL